MRLPILILLMFAVVACGPQQSEPGESDRQSAGAGLPSANEVIAESLREAGESDPNAIQYTTEEADCAADVIVAGVDANRLEELGLDLDQRAAPELTQPPLTSEEGDVIYRAFEECLDLRSQLIDTLPGGASLDRSEAECVADRYLASGVLREGLLTSDFDPDLNSRIDAALVDATEICSA